MAGAPYAAAVIACMDGRFREAVDYFVDETFGTKNVDMLFVPGASLPLVLGERAAANLWDGLQLAYDKHAVRRVIILEHEDCGKYAVQGIKARNAAEDRANHQSVARKAEALLRERFPGVVVEASYLTLAFVAEVGRKRARRSA